MSSPEHPALESAVLEANARFYSAFSAGDFPAMSELWARHAPVTCLHPGAPLLVGRPLVLASFREILSERPAFRLRCDSPVVSLHGEVAVVLCYEGGEGAPAHLAATNVFVLENGEFRMTHHQAGPLSSPRSDPRRTDLN
ncbi:MAG TPA: nuclear transport factor 2 family protein [Polyangiaceae bacterium]|nr:nuclear transport factor 2 family protein [Polyangiaceae bacterium]